MAYFKHLFIIHSSFVFSFKKYVLSTIMLRTGVDKERKSYFPQSSKKIFKNKP